MIYQVLYETNTWNFFKNYKTRKSAEKNAIKLLEKYKNTAVHGFNDKNICTSTKYYKKENI